VALQLKKRGITRVRPLQGGLDGWIAREFPVEKIAIIEPAEALTESGDRALG
jgi:3-mercaptopyruvate sulfurtransferase SseA